MRSTPHHRSRLVALAATAIVVLAACGDEADDALSTTPAASDEDATEEPDEPDEPTEINAELAGDWIAVDGVVDGASVTLLAAGPITIEIGDGGTVRGRAACNSYEGGADFGPDNVLSFGDLAITEMGCVDAAVMELERTYADSLAGLDRWMLDGETLVLSGAGAEWRFERSPADEPVDLVGTTWVLDTYLDLGTASNSVLFRSVTLLFADDGTFGGSSGCAAIVDGRWEERVIDAERTRPAVVGYETFVDPAAGACSDEVYVVEEQVLAVLDQSPDLNLAGDLLTLAGDGTALVFRAEIDDEPVDGAVAAPEGRPSTVSVRPVLGCGEDSLVVDADIIQVDPAQQLDCGLGPPIADVPVFTADAEATPDPSGQWIITVRVASGARDAWDAAAVECFEQGAECPTGQLAIVANGAIVSAPLVQTPTFPDELVISGNFTQRDAESIAASINAAG